VDGVIKLTVMHLMLRKLEKCATNTLHLETFATVLIKHEKPGISLNCVNEVVS
jgi:hypothetical protein